jgi:hypothetical protein
VDRGPPQRTGITRSRRVTTPEIGAALRIRVNQHHRLLLAISFGDDEDLNRH